MVRKIKLTRKVFLRNKTTKTGVLYSSFLFVIFNGFTSFSQEHIAKPHANHISVFAGYTINNYGKRGYKLGVEYGRRFSKHFGVGGAFDFTGKDYENYALSAGLTYKPFPFDLFLAFGPGIKSYSTKYYEPAVKPFFRSIITYEVHLSHFSIAPMVMFDIISKRNNMTSFGVSFGHSF